jgi:quercetin dioxygenase-like cupin family protein
MCLPSPSTRRTTRRHPDHHHDQEDLPMSVSQATHVRWSDLPRERLSEKLERRYVTGQHLTLAQFFLAKGCLVPTHDHESEQFANVLEGKLRFRLGVEGGEVVDVAAGEVLMIPSRLPHSAEALEDSVVFDSFSPVRNDWQDKRDDYLRR